jgi:riboflavin synthase alpha subunit
MENSIISNFKKELTFSRKKITRFVNMEIDPRLRYLDLIPVVLEV